MRNQGFVIGEVKCNKILLSLSDLAALRDEVLVSGIYLPRVNARNNKMRRRKKIHEEEAA
jgi:hypothetical protein